MTCLLCKNKKILRCYVTYKKNNLFSKTIPSKNAPMKIAVKQVRVCRHLLNELN